MANLWGYRGYIGSRAYMGQRTPQHIQNLVIRDFCQRTDKPYLLSVAEYAMENCYIMLEEILHELGKIEGIVLYSIFMLPEDPVRRVDTYQKILSAGATMHGAAESLSVTNEQDTIRIEDILRVNSLLSGSETILEVPN